MTSKLVFYSQSYPPDYWLLQDAVYWMAAQQLPLAGYGYDECENRESQEFLEEFLFELGKEVTPEILDPATTDRMGLPLDPRWQNYSEDGEWLLSPDHYEQLAKFVLDDDPAKTETYRAVQRQLYELALAQQQNEQNWAAILDDYLDQFVAQLILDLRNGHLCDEAIQVSEQLDGEENSSVREAIKNKLAGPHSLQTAYEPVPKDLWIRNKVDFAGNHLGV